MTATTDGRLFRAKTMNITRMIVLMAFGAATVFGDLFVAPISDGVLVVSAIYVGLVALYQPILQRTSKSGTLDAFQLGAFIVDITVLSILYAAINAWWLSSTVHVIIAMGACATFAWPRARIVAAYATIMFLLSLLVQVLGIGPELSFLGAPSLRGNYPLAFAVWAFSGAFRADRRRVPPVHFPSAWRRARTGASD